MQHLQKTGGMGGGGLTCVLPSSRPSLIVGMARSARLPNYWNASRATSIARFISMHSALRALPSINQALVTRETPGRSSGIKFLPCQVLIYYNFSHGFF